MAGEPRGLPFRHPLEAPSVALTARPVQLEASKGLPLLRPLDEVLAKYVQDRHGGSEGMHVFNFNDPLLGLVTWSAAAGQLSGSFPEGQECFERRIDWPLAADAFVLHVSGSASSGSPHLEPLAA
eukprot:s1150_g20.t1